MQTPLFQALALGFIQGITEFLPVSSSGHLALAQNLLPGFNQPGILLDVLLHAGTLAAVIVYFRADLIHIARHILNLLSPSQTAGPGPAGPDPAGPETNRLIIGVIIAQFPTAIIGLLIQDRAEAMFQATAAVGAALIATAIILAAGELIARRTKPQTGNPDWKQSLLIGIAQGIAVVPGLSRSGTTIAAAKALGVSGPQAARFSFLASIPAIAGAALLSIIKHRHELAAFTPDQTAAYIAGPALAAITGFIAIALIMRLIQAGRFIWFAPYLLILGAAAIIAGI